MRLYQNLGLKTYITWGGNGTADGGSIMFPEVLEALADASRSFIRTSDLHERAGRHLAKLIGVEAAYITSGAAAGVAIAVAACLTGKDWSKVHRLPDLPGEKPEVIIQVMQRNHYELMIRLAGAKLVEVGLANGTTAWHLESAITERTAALVHFVAYSPPTDLPIETVIEIGHQRGVPVIVDAAAAFPPFSELRRCTDMGADLAIFSGGKALRGPQSSGLVLGRRDLIEACAMNGSPFHGIGRPMKVGKEEIVALVNAVELWSNPEFERRQLAAWEERTDTFIKLMSDVRGVRVYRGDSPPASSGRAINPGWLQVAHVEWDQTVIPKTVQAACDELRQGEPGIIVPALRTGMMVSPQCLEPGEEAILAQRIKQVLRGQSG